MWIIPKTHNLYSAYAQEYLDSKEALKEQFEPLQEIGIFQSGEKKQSTLSLMWKSKPLSLQTWLDKWKRAYWIPHLFGRMLKLSMHGHFVIKYTESLEDIHVNRLATPASGEALKMKDTFTRIYLNRLKSSDRIGFISKMSEGIFQWDMTKYDETYQILAIELRKESLLRRKLVRPIDESDSLFSELWKTPQCSGGEGGVMELRSGTNAKIKLRDQAPYWTTPTSNANVGAHKPAAGGSPNLQYQVENWPTPASRDWRDGKSNMHDHNSRPLNEVVVLSSLPDKAIFSTKEKHPARLNPAWSIQLMGTTLQRTFTALLVIRLWSKQQN